MDGPERHEFASRKAISDATQGAADIRQAVAPRHISRHATQIVIARLTAGQRAIVSRRQLLAHGVSASAIRRAVRTGRLHDLLPGVYGALPLATLPALGREQAAILAYAPDAYLSHETAAAFWGLHPGGAHVRVTVVGRNVGPGTRWVRVHNAATLDRRDTRMRQGLLLTAPARTILDLAPSLTTRQLAKIFDEALHRHLVRRSEIRAMLDRHPRRPGCARLAALAHEDRKTAWTRSKTERRLVALLHKARLPMPDVNTRFGPFELDFYWPEQRLAVETDGYEFHSSQRDLERDHQRDLALQAAGVMIVRFSWRQVRDEPEMVIAQIAGLLARRRVA